MSLDDEVPSTHAPYLGYRQGRQTAPGWTNWQLCRIFSVRAQTIGRWRNGLQYPDVSGLKKIEIVMGWPASEQIDLIPLGEVDLRWSMVFNEVLKEWMIANPREIATDDLVPLVKSRAPGGGRKKNV